MPSPRIPDASPPAAQLRQLGTGPKELLSRRLVYPRMLFGVHRTTHFQQCFRHLPWVWNIPGNTPLGHMGSPPELLLAPSIRPGITPKSSVLSAVECVNVPACADRHPTPPLSAWPCRLLAC